MGIITNVGDKGTTRLFSGEEVSKSHIRPKTYGAMDELVAFMGLARAKSKNKEIKKDIFEIQKDLFRLGTDLATKDKNKMPVVPITDTDVLKIEMLITKYESSVGELHEFSIPGENEISALLDVCRTVCRRFERKIVKITEANEWKNPFAIIFVNRMSDLLFLMARLEEK